MLAVTPTDVVAGLRRGLGPAASLHETHASWVVVGADRAIKLKKPVVLPFLDYGTLERRHAACRAEVELNRRLAPDIYLGVASVVPAEHGAALAPEDDPRAIEYAVLMRRFVEADTLAARIARGTVSASEVECVGARLARFHAAAERADADGGAEPVKRWLDDTHASLRGLLPAGRGRRLIAEAERFAAAFLTARWDELDARARSGRVRDGHGDLRAEHVLLERDGIRIVDCIEFEPGLRRIDVAADLAFLVMDLEAAERRDLARHLVSGYRDAGGDPGDDALVSWLAAYRAHVRAKVALLRAGQQAGGDRAGSHAEAERLLGIADRLIWRARGPVTIAVGGLSGAGKTTLARALAARARVPHLSSDVVRKAQAGLAPSERGAAGLYTAERTAAVYTELGRAAAAARDGAVVDATFRSRCDRDLFRWAHQPPRRVLHVECVTPAGKRLSRATAREHTPDRVSDADREVARHQTMDPMDEIAADWHVVVRGDGSLAAQVSAVADALDRALLGPD